MNIAVIGDSFPESLLLDNDGYPSIIYNELSSYNKEGVRLEKYTKSGVLLKDVTDLLNPDFYATNWDYVILHCGNFESYPSISKKTHKFLFNKWIQEDLRHRLKYRSKLTELSFDLKQKLRGILNYTFGVDFKTSNEAFYTEYKSIIEHLKNNGVRNIIIVSLSKVDEYINKNYNQYILNYNEIIKEIGTELNVKLIDVLNFPLEASEKVHTKDGWHWNETGHTIVASEILKEVFGHNIKNKKCYKQSTNNKNQSLSGLLSIKNILRIIELIPLSILIFYFKTFTPVDKKRKQVNYE
ncbi:SGNH/GDSL hydrolase family protein [Neobacillus cucumis]|uniref:SGNH/GDSL hydrolase family protein n=1 Tax=Neobacillus cucumis TaxID=1740721 RepID=UPI00196266FD|nr:SGNH/GDSL hydrolase family protein [Neobacillus cucumis]MBM7652547.1 hypothetical protein [Neobacillus cucumis]